jgi:hypothetical protein
MHRPSCRRRGDKVGNTEQRLEILSQVLSSRRKAQERYIARNPFNAGETLAAAAVDLFTSLSTELSPLEALTSDTCNIVAMRSASPRRFRVYPWVGALLGMVFFARLFPQWSAQHQPQSVFPGPPRFSLQSTLRKIGALLCAAGLHIPSRKLTARGIQYLAFAIINACRNAIAQAAQSGGSKLESPRRPFLHITGSTATTEPQS